MKKRILFVYHSMIIGGSTTSLLSFMNGLDSEKYEIDLQLFRNKGPLLEVLPLHVNLLPAAEVYAGARGRIVKLFKFVFKGYLFRAVWKGLTGKSRKLYSRAAIADFQAKELSRKNTKQYDYAIGYLEGWSDRYLAFGTNAAHKYAWLHSTFANITSEPEAELSWMSLVDKIVFVTEACRMAFADAVPQMAEKSITVENITDSDIIRQRSRMIDAQDKAYTRFVSADAFKIITVCRLTVSVKGLDRIVAAAAELKKSGKRFLWYIVGDGEGCDQLQSMIETTDVGDCVIPIGKRMNPYPFIAAADVMCMPSRYEGKPMAITESMILGVPPVVTEYLSAHDQVKNGEEGIVVPNTDDAIIAPLAEMIEHAEVCDMLKKTLSMREYGNVAYLAQIETELFFEETNASYD